MSYILDALRRADAERERGAVPNIHAQPFGQLPEDDDEPARRPRSTPWIIGGLSIALLAALGWSLLRPQAARDEAGLRAPAALPQPAPRVAAPEPPPVASPAPPPGATATPAAPVATTPPAAPATPGPAVEVAKAPEPAKAIRKPAPRKAALVASDGPAATTPAARGANDVRAADADKGRAAEKSGSAEGEKRVLALRDLPDAVRRELPTIVVSGSTYSTNRESRMLMIGGQIFHEGDAVAKGVVLRAIKPRAAVFAYRDYLYEIAF